MSENNALNIDFKLIAFVVEVFLIFFYIFSIDIVYRIFYIVAKKSHSYFW